LQEIVGLSTVQSPATEPRKSRDQNRYRQCVRSLSNTKIQEPLAMGIRFRVHRVTAMHRLAVVASFLIPVIAMAQSNGPQPQDATMASLKFEVASVKASKSASTLSPGQPSPARGGVLPGGRFSATNFSLRELILWAYDVGTSNLLEGGPDWLDSARYDIDAKPEAGVIPAGAHGRAVWDKTRAMLRALLADRFHLVMRRESKAMPLYEISVAKNGPKLTKSTRDCSADMYACHGFSGNPRRLSAMGVDMADLASELTGFAGRPVLDKTGITGEFDFLLQWNPFYGRQRATQTTDDTPLPPARNEGPMPDIDSLPDLGTALDQQLGLKLEARKGLVETFVIVSVERPS
jgi:uncharacterized protein (TIGR03435 family)